MDCINIIDLIKQYNQSLNQAIDNEQYESNDVTELQMHKVLFFVYGAFYKKFQIKLWDAQFFAWKYGPVELNYRHTTKTNDNKQLCINHSLTSVQKEYLNYLVNKLLKMSVWRLVDFSHTLNSWLKNKDTSNKMDDNDIWQDFENITI